MPVAALAVGEIWVDSRVIQENNFFTWVALIVLVDCFNQGAGHARTIALCDVANALIGSGLQNVQALSGAEFVVEANHFKFDAGCVDLAVFFSEELKALELIVAHRRHQARQGVNPCDFDGFAFLSEGTKSTHCQ